MPDFANAAVVLQGIAVVGCVVLFFMGVDYGTKWG